MTSKTGDKKTMNKAAKKVGISPGRAKKDVTLREQYNIIRSDLMRLRDDIAKGYSMTKDWIDKRGGLKGNLLKAK